MLMITPNCDGRRIDSRKPSRPVGELHGRLFAVVQIASQWAFVCRTWISGRLKADEEVARFDREQEADQMAAFLADHMAAAW